MIRDAAVALGLLGLAVASAGGQAWTGETEPMRPRVDQAAESACHPNPLRRGSGHALPEGEAACPHPGSLPGEGRAAIEIRDHGDGDRLVHRLSLDETGTFALVFTHSMYGGAVAEAYQVTSEPVPRLQRFAVHTERAAAAEYYARYGEFQRDGEMWRVDAASFETPRLHVRADHVGSPHLRVGDARLDLLDLVPSGHVVTLRPSVEPR